MEYPADSGIMRGQTERYMIVLGRLVKEYFNTVSGLFSFEDPAGKSNAELQRLLDSSALSFLIVNDSNKEKMINIIRNFEQAFRLKGTYDFFRWIIYNIFGWFLLSIDSIYNRRVLKTNTAGNTLYAPGQTETFTLFSSRLLSFNISVDIASDPDFLDKKENFEYFMGNLMFNGTFEYT